jgi:hypothetical protein
MKKIVYVVLLLLILGGAGFFLYSRNKSQTPTKQYGILNPDTSVITPVPDNYRIPLKSSETTGKVLGSTDQAKPTPVVASKPIAQIKPQPVEVKPVVKKEASQKTESHPTTSTYKIPELNFVVTVPADWQPRLETAAGNVLAFYNASGSRVGQIEVIPDAEQSYDSLVAEISANPNVSNIQQITINGQPAVIFNDQRYGGGKVIAVAYKNNVYYLRGNNALRPYSESFKFLN